MPESQKSGPAPMGKMVIYRAEAAPTLEESGMVVERSFVEEGSRAELWPEAYAERPPAESQAEQGVTGASEATVPFRQDAADGFSLVSLDFGPGFLLPRHSHSSDCLYYIIDGEIVMGTRVLGAGDGFFVPAGQPYAYRAGPKGVKLLEFRNRTAFDTTFYEKSMAQYRAKAEASLAAAKAQAEG